MHAENSLRGSLLFQIIIYGWMELELYLFLLRDAKISVAQLGYIRMHFNALVL